MSAMKKIDLHSHSNKSDGILSPSELLQRAKEQGVDILALTDHDTTNGLAEASQTAQDLGIQLINGVEISATWEDKTIHIVGLDFDVENSQLQEILSHHQNLRAERAKVMAEKVESLGVENTYAKVRELAKGDISRTHFAQLLVSHNIVKTPEQAFKKYLLKGKKAYVKVNWQSILKVIEVINNAGGKAVLAHPLRYELTNRKLRLLALNFKNWGGAGIEVANCSQSPSDRLFLTEIALKNNLKASMGSDFHYPCPWRELGRGLDFSPKLKFILDL